MALSVNKISMALATIAVASAVTIGYSWQRMQQINAFNDAVRTSKTPQTDKQSFQAKFAVAYWLSKNERLKEATLLYSQLADKGTPVQRAAALHNIGNIFFIKSLQVSGGNDNSTRDEVEYLLNQAKNSYKGALKLDNRNWGTRRNLDRVLSLLPEKQTPGVGESDNPGLIMGNIPNGLP